MEQAIKIAIENGYTPIVITDEIDYKQQEFFCLISPIFWQALGKGLKFDEEFGFCPDCKNHKGDLAHEDACGIGYKWKRTWHRFIDHIAEGKDVDSFFTELIK